MATRVDVDDLTKYTIHDFDFGDDVENVVGSGKYLPGPKKYANFKRLYMAILGFWPKRCMCCTTLLHGKGHAAHIHLRNDQTEQYLGAMCNSCRVGGTG